MCQNVLRRDGALEAPFVHISEHVYDKFQIMADHDVFALADHLERVKAQGVTAAVFARKQKASGLTYSANGLLWDRELRQQLAPSQANYDPMHVFFSNGIFGSEVQCLFEVVDRLHCQGLLSVCSKDFVELAAGKWETPNFPCFLHSCQSQRKRWAELVLKDKASASQALAMWPLLDVFVRTALSQHQMLGKHVASFLSLCAVVRHVRRIAHGSLADHGVLSCLQQKHMLDFVEAYGRSKVRPKNHYQFHLGLQKLRWTVLLDCWTAERKHKDFKEAARQWNGKDFAKHMLVKLILHETATMLSKGFEDGLKDHVLTVKGKSYHRGMCLLFLDEAPAAFVIQNFCTSNDGFEAHGQQWQLAPKLHSGFLFDYFFAHLAR